VLVINALRKEEHISHISLSEAIHIARKVNAENTYFSHISHHLGLHDEVSRELPENIHLAYDNLSINI
jgi:phosphoribosyl 1,2-cyclic phosphate phosphodiesterase